jgi:hypothetical protein
MTASVGALTGGLCRRLNIQPAPAARPHRAWYLMILPGRSASARTSQWHSERCS